MISLPPDGTQQGSGGEGGTRNTTVLYLKNTLRPSEDCSNPDKIRVTSQAQAIGLEVMRSGHLWNTLSGRTDKTEQEMRGERKRN